MVALLHLLSYVGAVTAFVFVTLSLASGLLWIAELIEEHSRTAKKIGVRGIYVIIVLHALLFVFDSLPFWYIVFGIVCHLVYLQHFSKSWPFISLTSPTFILSCVLVVVDHFIWFFYFAGVAQEAKKYRAARYRYSAQTSAYKEAPTFLDVATFFAICVWFIPLFLFLSLSANDNVIPSFDSSAPSTPSGGATIDLSGSPTQRPSRAGASLVRSVLTPIVSLLPRIGRRGRSDEGLIAPRTPSRMSPSPSMDTYAPWGADTLTSAPQPLSTPPPQMYTATSSSLGILDSRLNAVAANRAPTPPPPRSKRNSTSSDYAAPAPGGGDQPPVALAALGSGRPVPIGAVRNRSFTADSKKAD